MDYDEDDEGFGGLYENGKWLWDDKEKSIVFLSNLRPKTFDEDIYTCTAPTGEFIEFREDVDLIEQMRYRRLFQRKLEPGQTNIITLQDVKDLVLYTAPVNFLSLKLINILHTSTGERFLRALILYCAYCIQVAETMISRTLELESKVRSPNSDLLEDEYCDNLADLRILVAKEYCTILVGAGDMKPFHHMGPLKKRRSFLAKDARSFEIFIRVCVQIVYLSLGRKYFHQIELETHRLLKSETFNAVEHKSQEVKAHAQVHNRPGHTKAVLMGKCRRHERQLNTHSPLMNELFCTKPIDYRMKGLGVVKYPDLTPRLRYLFLAVAVREEIMADSNIIIGIIGMPRTKFDTMLRFLPTVAAPFPKSKSSVAQSISKVSPVQSSSKSVSVKKPLGFMRHFPEIVIPPKVSVETVAPKDFADESEDVIPVNEIQRRLWQNRLRTLMALLAKRQKHR